MTSPVSQVFFPVSATNLAVADPAVSGVTNDPIMQPVSGLVLFTPRLPRGITFPIADYLVQAAANAVQTVYLINNPTQGVWALQLLGTWTADLAFDVSNATLQAALITAAGASAGDITVVTGATPASFDVQFANNLGAQTIPIMNADPKTLENAMNQGCEVTVAGQTTGLPQVVAPTAISIPPLQARIWNGVLSTIDVADTPGFQLASNMPEYNLSQVLGPPNPPTFPNNATNLADLVYDVTYSKVTYNGGPGVVAPWAFVAPTDNTPVCLTDPALTRLPYQPPVAATWQPPNVVAVREAADWRTRSAG